MMNCLSLFYFNIVKLHKLKTLRLLVLFCCPHTKYHNCNTILFNHIVLRVSLLRPKHKTKSLATTSVTTVTHLTASLSTTLMITHNFSLANSLLCENDAFFFLDTVFIVANGHILPRWLNPPRAFACLRPC